jgi:hypothetical protein
VRHRRHLAAAFIPLPQFVAPLESVSLGRLERTLDLG